MDGIDDWGIDTLPPLISGGSDGTGIFSSSPAEAGAGSGSLGIDWQQPLNSILDFVLQRSKIDSQTQLAMAQQRQYAPYGYTATGVPVTQASASLNGLMPLLLLGGVIYAVVSIARG